MTGGDINDVTNKGALEYDRGHKSVTEGPNWKGQVQLGTKNYNVKDCLMQPFISEFAKSKKDKASTRLQWGSE